ncbi:YnfU family zinc-binding protein [Hafnia psychrotolerans]
MVECVPLPQRYALMSFFDGLKFLSSQKTKVTCPECKAVTEQISAKVRKNSTLVCPKCGALFQPKDR